ncbi:MAG TPA: methyltransferase [Kofleriaceae bacterium]|nr:methyltransferase [Kofleriaceae bacterium]
MNARSLLSLLHHADKALELVRTARDLGIAARLDTGPVSLRVLADETKTKPLRLYKFLDGLESLGLVTRRQPTDELLASEYVSNEPLVAAIEAVLGEQSIERDRDRYPWREIHGRLPEVLAGKLDARFAWPPGTADEIRDFERAMAAGCPPIIEAFLSAQNRVFDGAKRWLDVGGGDGTVAAAVLRERSTLVGDVFNLADVAPLVAARARAAEVEPRLGFVAGDFLAGPLPRGYDVISFVRVLHDWPADVARSLLVNARDALAPGGRLVICEEFRDRDRLAVQFFWTYFLIGVDACVSRLRDLEWYVEALTRLDCGVELVPGAFDLVIATRR